MWSVAEHVLVLVLVLLLAPLAQAHTQHRLSAERLLGPAGLCGGLASCDSPPVPGTSQRNCECDPPCWDYNDCCEDSPHFGPGISQATCIPLRHYGQRLIFNTCPSSWPDNDTRQLCECVDMQTPDPLASTLVTHRPTGRTFANVFCAICHDHGRPESLSVWRKRLECPSVHRDVDAGDIMDNVYFDVSLGTWTINISGHSHHCKLDSYKPDGVDEFSRECWGNPISTCPSGWHNDTVASMCESYTSTVYEISRRVMYRNPHCALCNDIPLSNITCSIPQGRYNGYKFDMQSFAILFDFSTTTSKGSVGKIQACHDNQLFDPFFGICRAIFCSQGQIYAGNSCISNENPSSEPSEVEYKTVLHNCTKNVNINQDCVDSKLINTCPKFRLSHNEYIANNNSYIYVPKYDKIFLQKEYVNGSDGSVYICAAAIGQKFIDKFGPLMGYITIIGLGISILFLIIHLVASTYYSELKSLPSKNLASLVMALLSSYIFFIKMIYMQSLGTTCIAVGFITYYSFMASLAWTLTIGVDIWWALRQATSQLLVSSGRRTCRFLLYSACSWGAPMLLLTAVVLVDTSPAGTMPEHLRPGIGKTSCWFHSRQALLLFFALPFAAVMLLNIFFAYGSVVMIQSTAAANATSTSRRHVSMYVRLAVITGLTWIVGLMAGYLDVHMLWYVFVALNTLQGLFIFLSFTLSTKMARQLRASSWQGRVSSTLTTRFDTSGMCGKKREKSPLPPELNIT